MRGIYHILVILFLLGGTSLCAQKRKMDRCRLILTIPEHFSSIPLDRTFLTYSSKKSKASIAVFKSVGDSNYELYTARSVSMAFYYDLLRDESTYDRTIQDYEIEGMDFAVISWIRERSDKSTSYHMVAYNDDCNVIYRVELLGRVKDKEDISLQFLDLLGDTKMMGKKKKKKKRS